jgi:hypothetical protein
LGFLAFAVGGEAEADIYLFAEGAFAGEQQCGQVDVGLASLFECVAARKRSTGEFGKLG